MRLGELLKRPPRYGISAAAVPYDSDLPTYIRITDIDERGRFSPSPSVSVNSPLSGNYQLADGDLVIARTGASVGKSYRYSPDDGPLVFAGFLITTTPDPRWLDPAYLGHYLQSNTYWDWVRAASMRSGQPGINAQQVAALPIEVPSIDAQRKIATLLDAADQAVESTHRLVSKKQAIKQGIMQELLAGRTRLPGFVQPWRNRKLGDLLTFEQPGRYLVSSSDYVKSGTPVLTAGKTFLLGYTSEREGVYDSLPVVIFDDFTTASKYVTFPFKAKSSAMKILAATSGTDLRFVYERMQLINFVAVDHKRRWITEYSKLEVAIPDLAEQSAIASVIEDAEHEIAVLERSLESTRNVKQGMMQELLTGRTRLIADEVAT